MMGAVKRCGWLTVLILCNFLIVTASSHAAAAGITGTLDFSTLETTLYTMPFDGSTGLTTISSAYLEVSAQKDDDIFDVKIFNGTAVSAEVDGAQASFETSLLSVEVSPGDGIYYSASGWGYADLTPATAGLLAISIDYTWEIDTLSFSEEDWSSIHLYLSASTWDDGNTNKSVFSDIWIDEYTSGTSGSGTLDLYVQVDGGSDVWVDGGINASAYMAPQTPVPLPSSFALFFTGIAGLTFFTRRKFV